MRRVPLLLFVLLSGCASWSGTAAARRAVYREALDAQRFQVPPSEVAWRLRSQAGLFTECAHTNAGQLDCRACTTNGCSKLVDEGGATHIVPDADLTEREVGTLWLALDPQGYRRELGTNLDARVEGKRIELERSFQPRWGFTGGVLAGAPFDGTSAGIGVRAGVRRWFDVHLLGHTALEYRWRGDHELHLRVGLEVSPSWTEGRLWGEAGAPPASVSMFIGPLLRVPTLTPGIRTGVGVHITDIRSAPFFVEFSGDTLLLGEQSRVTLTATIGIGI